MLLNASITMFLCIFRWNNEPTVIYIILILFQIKGNILTLFWCPLSQPKTTSTVENKHCS